MGFILEDTNSDFWLISVNDSGILSSASTASGPAVTLTLNDVGQTTSWKVEITTGGILETVSTTYGSGNPTSYAITSTTGLSTWKLEITSAGILETTVGVWSPVDCRVAVRGFGPGANQYRVVQDADIYDVQTSDNSKVPGTDSRISKPVDSRVAAIIPLNSRTAPPF
jgi:hypothetical protein